MVKSLEVEGGLGKNERSDILGVLRRAAREFELAASHSDREAQQGTEHGSSLREEIEAV
jgi:hypothetical protein